MLKILLIFFIFHLFFACGHLFPLIFTDHNVPKLTNINGLEQNFTDLVATPYIRAVTTYTEVLQPLIIACNARSKPGQNISIGGSLAIGFHEFVDQINATYAAMTNFVETLDAIIADADSSLEHRNLAKVEALLRAVSDKVKSLEKQILKLHNAEPSSGSDMKNAFQRAQILKVELSRWHLKSGMKHTAHTDDTFGILMLKDALFNCVTPFSEKLIEEKQQLRKQVEILEFVEAGLNETRKQLGSLQGTLTNLLSYLTSENKTLETTTLTKLTSMENTMLPMLRFAYFVNDLISDGKAASNGVSMDVKLMMDQSVLAVVDCTCKGKLMIRYAVDEKGKEELKVMMDNLV